MKKLILVMAIIVLTGITVGCSNQENGLEGKWISSIKNTWDGTNVVQKIEIKKNGENYIINSSTEQYKSDEEFKGPGKAIWKTDPKKPTNAVLKDGKLIIAPYISFTIVKSDKTIQGPNGETYKQETIDEFNRLKKESGESYKKRYPQITLSE